MAHRIAAFGALFFTGLVAGIALVIWIEFNPSGMSANYYTQSMQHAIAAFTVPLPSIVLLSVAFTGWASFLERRHKRKLYLLFGGCLCSVIVALVTVFGNIPINNQVQTWAPAAPPLNWSRVAAEWWHYQSVRTLAALSGLALVILGVLNSEKRPSA